jgi:hypothetical protein
VGERDLDAVLCLRRAMVEAPAVVVGSVPPFVVRPLAGWTWGSIERVSESALESQASWDAHVATLMKTDT